MDLPQDVRLWPSFIMDVFMTGYFKKDLLLLKQRSMKL